MGLQTWKNVPKGKILKSDVSIAKNYLAEKEIKADDKVKFTRLADKIYDDNHFRESIKTNTKSNLKLLFKKLFDEAMADMYESDLNFFKKIDENPSIKELIKDNLFEDVFKRGKEAQL